MLTIPHYRTVAWYFEVSEAEVRRLAGPDLVELGQAVSRLITKWLLDFDTTHNWSR
jgi:hypothetical protein